METIFCTSDLADKDMLARTGEVSSDRGGLQSFTFILSGRDWRLSALVWCGRFFSCGGDREGENSGAGKIGSTLEVSGAGDPRRANGKGGGVVESALGLG